ncbi:MAG: response regulator [Pseudomonadota bacterium]
MSEKKILLVDDEKAILNLLSQVFSKAGYMVLTAESAEQALEIVENENVSVSFFDLNLPGMNGIDLCRAVKKQRPMSIMYAITGYASIFELAECREAGFEDYFKKPVNIKTLLKTAEDAFEKLSRWKDS